LNPINPEPPLPDTQAAASVKPTPAVYYAQKKGYDPVLTQKVWNAAEAQGMSPTMALALVSHESRFQTEARNVNTNRTIDYGLFQLNSQYHPWFDWDVDKHIQYGMKFLADNIRRYGTQGGLGIYNVGRSQKPDKVAERAIYVGKVMGEYQDVKRTMAGYAGWDPKFQMSILSPTEIAKQQGSG